MKCAVLTNDFELIEAEIVGTHGTLNVVQYIPNVKLIMSKLSNISYVKFISYQISTYENMKSYLNKNAINPNYWFATLDPYHCLSLTENIVEPKIGDKVWYMNDNHSCIYLGTDFEFERHLIYHKYPIPESEKKNKIFKGDFSRRQPFYLKNIDYHRAKESVKTSINNNFSSDYFSGIYYQYFSFVNNIDVSSDFVNSRTKIVKENMKKYIAPIDSNEKSLINIRFSTIEID